MLQTQSSTLSAKERTDEICTWRIVAWNSTLYSERIFVTHAVSLGASKLATMELAIGEHAAKASTLR